MPEHVAKAAHRVPVLTRQPLGRLRLEPDCSFGDALHTTLSSINGAGIVHKDLEGEALPIRNDPFDVETDVVESRLWPAGRHTRGLPGKARAQPKARAHQVKMLKGRDGYRLRVGKWRVIFDVDGTVLEVLEVGARGNIYS